MNKKMKIKKIFLASDHAGFLLKQVISKFLKRKGIKIMDLGPKNINSVDYPDFAHLLAKKMNKQKNNIGILVCGSGEGMAMTVNRHKNIRGALCYNTKSTKLSKMHNNANVMAIGSRLTKKSVALRCIDIFLNTNFEGGRHLRRIKKI